MLQRKLSTIQFVLQACRALVVLYLDIFSKMPLRSTTRKSRGFCFKFPNFISVLSPAELTTSDFELEACTQISISIHRLHVNHFISHFLLNSHEHIRQATQIPKLIQARSVQGTRHPVRLVSDTLCA